MPSGERPDAPHVIVLSWATCSFPPAPSRLALHLGVDASMTAGRGMASARLPARSSSASLCAASGAECCGWCVFKPFPASFFLSSDTANFLIKWNDHSGCILRKDQKGKCSLLFSWVISTDIFEFTAAPVCHIRLAGTLITRIFLLTRGFLVVRRDFH